MLNTRIILSGLWVAVMLTYLWGDVLTIFAGDMKPGEMGGVKVTQPMLFGIGVLMLTPILMFVLTLTLPYPAIRWVNIIVAIFWIIFNLISLSGYPAYNKFLLSVSVIFNAITVWYAWKWLG
ncbi:MAG: hypothetical protein JSV42_17220 [Chloroflexota bacterium]|nr:MAG: hypothetical protein JSV42_17220 [Chloroflexota bacterium]